jgi:protoporphyrinogen/coproporphyrinogen III oxidase
MSGAPARPVPRVVVVGGGISGLAAAHRLVEQSQQLHLPIQLELLEAGNRLGGVIHTVQREGFLLEGGPDSFISEKPWALSLCQKLGLGANLIGTGTTFRRSLIVRKGKLVPVPEGFYLLAPTQIWPFMTTPIFSWAGKLRMAADLFLPRRSLRVADQDESLAYFVRRRLGREALERMAQPMVGGIYTSDPEELSLRATMPRLLEMEQRHRSLILALWRQKEKMRHSQENQSSGPRYGLFISLDEGMQTLVKALQEKLPRGSVRLNSAVNSLGFRPTAPNWILKLQDGTAQEADAVCLALASYQSAKLLEGVDNSQAEKLRQIRYTSTATVNLAYRREDIPHQLDGFGFVVPAIEKLEILACTFCHVKFERRAPQNHALLRTFVGGALQPEVFEYEDEKMIRVVRGHLKDLLGITRDPIFSQVERHPRAMAQYRVGHLELLEQIESRVRNFPTLQLAGNAFTGLGIPDCIHRAEVCADRILAELVKKGVD